MYKQILILVLSIFILSCGNKKNNTSQAESTILKQEIDSLKLVSEEIENTEESIDASIKKLDDMLNEMNK